MASNTAVQKLNEIRLASLRQASENRNIDALMSWHSKDATFVIPGQNVLTKGREAACGFYATAYKAQPTFKITESKSTGFTPEFVACEMKCEGQCGSDLPAMGFKTGNTVSYIGVSLFWWRWEGEGEWDGSLSEEVVRSWKIIEEHAYYQMEVVGHAPGNKNFNQAS